MLTKEQVIKQSETALKQWDPQWTSHAKMHAKFNQNSLEDLKYSGIGKAIVCIANGSSIENDLQHIKKYQDTIDTFVCDKALGHSFENGITPTYCMVADANVSYEEYCEPWKDRTKDVVLLMNVCANPKWSHEAEWKKIYFYVNMDAIKSEEKFKNITKCPNVIAAGSNVSNAMIVMLTQCREKLRCNYFGYDKILCSGFDYCWTPEGNYYAFDKQGGGKHSYMRHSIYLNSNGDPLFTSSNMVFSAKWLRSYIENYKLPVIQCSKTTLMDLPLSGDIKKHLDYKFREEDSGSMLELERRERVLIREINVLRQKKFDIDRAHVTRVQSTL